MSDLTITKLRRDGDFYRATVTAASGEKLDVHNRHGAWHGERRSARHSRTFVACDVMPHVALELQKRLRPLRKKEAAANGGTPTNQEEPMSTATLDPTTKAKARKARAKKPTAAKPASTKAAPLGFRQAAVEILRESDGPMRTRELTEKALARGVKTKGKTPVSTMAAQLLGEEFVRTDPGTYDLRELNPRGAKKRPAKK